MKSHAWIVLAALFMGCAPKAQPILKDAGAFPEVDPYDHRLNPQYTVGAMAGFRSLYVDPESYPSTMSPVEPPPAPPIQVEGPDLPEGMFPAVVLQVDMTKLNEGQRFEDVVSAISKSRKGVVVHMPSTGLVFFPAVESEKIRARTIRRLGNTRVGSATINSLGTLAVLDVIPKPAANSMVKTNPEGEEEFRITLVPRPPAPIRPDTGDLLLENIATAWAEVEINDAKVGIVGPLAHSKIANVKAGTYLIKFTLPNGYSWSEKRKTTGEQ